MGAEVENLLEPLHTWVVGEPRARGTVMVLEYPAAHVYKRKAKTLLFLSELWVPLNARGRGYARILIKAATDWADSSKTDLWLYIAPNGPEPRLSHQQLEDMYARHGFKTVRRRPDVEMVRRHA